jgi:hypothetical protein
MHTLVHDEHAVQANHRDNGACMWIHVASFIKLVSHFAISDLLPAGGFGQKRTWVNPSSVL